MNAIRDVDHLDDLLSDPPPGVVETIRRLDGDILVLGVSGKMGPTLARMAKRAVTAAGLRRRVIGVARFSSGGEEPLWAHGVDTIRAQIVDDAERRGALIARFRFSQSVFQRDPWAERAAGKDAHEFRPLASIPQLEAAE